MKYLLKRYGLDQNDPIELNEDIFEAINNSVSTLTAYFSIEESFDILLENYLHFEKHLLCVSVNNITNSNEFENNGELRREINRNIINLLSTCRRYLDLTSKILSLISPEVRDLFEKERSKEYDNNFSYRILEALRNHTQHAGFPIHYFSVIRHKEIQIDGSNLFSISTIPFIEREKLSIENKDFKKSVLSEMTEDKYDIRKLSREYISALSRIQNKVRENIKNKISECDGIIHAAEEEYSSKFGNFFPAVLLAAKVDENGTFKNKILIISNRLITGRKILEKKNIFGEYADKTFITNILA